MIHDPPPPYISVGCPPCYSLAFSTLTHPRPGLHVREPGLRFNEPGPQGEKNNYLSRHQGGESPTPPRLFHVCIYSCVSEGGRCVSVRFFLAVLPSASLPLHGRGDKWWVTQGAGGQTPWPNYLSVFSHFLASFSLSLSHFFLLSVFFLCL